MPSASLRSAFSTRYFARARSASESQPSCPPQQVGGPADAQPAFDVDDTPDALQEPHRCAKGPAPARWCIARPQCFRHDVNALGRCTRVFEIFATQVDPPGIDHAQALCSASSKLRPMAITSPTDFIDDPMLCEALRNFCRSQRGAFTDVVEGGLEAGGRGA